VLARVLATIREHDLIHERDRVLVAVSGGPDSTALLHALVKLSRRLGVTLTVACVDHGLRQESRDEAQMVCQRCRALGLASEVLEVDVARARHAHVSLQEAARDVRLAALEQAAARLGCNKIALGHTADDQAETVLFRILRGTGLAGLAGIPYRRGCFVRPLLDVRRVALIAYLAKRKIVFISDPSNANPRYARSRIRHDVLPMLARENPRVVEALLALAAEARGRGVVKPWRDDLPSHLYLSKRTSDAVDRLVRQGSGTRRIAVKQGDVVVTYGKVEWQPGEPRIQTEGELPEGGARTALALAISAPGTYRLDASLAPAVEILAVSSLSIGQGARAVLFDKSKLSWPLCLRLARPGDRMAPRSGRGTRKLSDLMIDAKIPRPQRARLPVLCDASGAILFVPGLRPSHLGQPDATTQECLEVRLTR
jgi:tRNA(Ile)-lysidine synthase